MGESVGRLTFADVLEIVLIVGSLLVIIWAASSPPRGWPWDRPEDPPKGPPTTGGGYPEDRRGTRSGAARRW